MSKKLLNRSVRLLLLLLAVSFAVACLPSGAPAAPTAEEAGAIYAAVIRQIYTEDDTFGGTLQPPTLYVVTETDDSVGAGDADPEPSTTLSAEMQAAIEMNLSDLNTQIVWVESQENAPLDSETGAVEGGAAVITLGNLHPQRDGSYHVPSSIYVASLAAGGQTFIVEPADAGWTVTGTTGPRWIS